MGDAGAYSCGRHDREEFLPLEVLFFQKPEPFSFDSRCEDMGGNGRFEVVVGPVLRIAVRREPALEIHGVSDFRAEVDAVKAVEGQSPLLTEQFERFHPELLAGELLAGSRRSGDPDRHSGLQDHVIGIDRTELQIRRAKRQNPQQSKE